MSVSIAIVGMACRYPDANSPMALWETILSGRRAFRRMPDTRLRLADYAGDGPDSIYPIQAAVLENYGFDRARFRVPGNAFAATDLTHWLALDVATEALDNAGLLNAAFDRGRAGAIVGNSLAGEFSRAGLTRLRWPYVRRQVAAALSEDGYDTARRDDLLDRLEDAFKAPFPEPDEEMLAGGLANTIAGRICNHHDLHGGGFTVDGACASSLLAIADACAKLESGEMDTVLAGGVDLSLDPFELIGFARNGALSKTLMRVFDARSDGFWPGEGCGFVTLMRYEDALRLGLEVHAVIRGWGISSDGQGGLTRPTVPGQRLALERAYRKAGYGPGSVALFEAHGTGTAVGDPIEVAAIAEARRADAPSAPPAVVGSVKANIGHTKAAAGLAGLIKSTMALRHGILPAATGCETVNPAILAHADSVRVSPETRSWPGEGPRRAGVSAMGFGGINVHIALEAVGPARAAGLSASERRLMASAWDAELFLFAAPDRAALRAQVAGVAERVGEWSRAELTDAAAELARRVETGHPSRAMAVASNPAEMANRLQTLLFEIDSRPAGGIDPSGGIAHGVVRAGVPRIVYIFPGQAAPTVDGGLWRRNFARVGAIYDAISLPAGPDGTATEIAQPAISAASAAGLAMLDQLGFSAAAGVGHSMGELAALHWAGAWDAVTLVRIAAARGALMAKHGLGGGAMALIAAAPDKVASLLEGTSAVIACVNASEECIVAGLSAEVATVAAQAKALGIRVHTLLVSHAFHSPLVAPAAAPVGRMVAAEPAAPLTRTVVSTVTGVALPADADLAALVERQMTAPVRFHDAFAQAVAGAELAIEVGPGTGMTRLAGTMAGCPAIALEAGGAGIAGLLLAAGAGFVLGAAGRVPSLYEDRFTRPFDLDRPRRFLANPCEAAPVDGVRPARARPLRMDRAPAKAVEAGLSPLDTLRAVIARKLDLDVSAIAPEHGLLRDLHLNSIAVGQLVAEAARAMGFAPPANPSNFASVTVAEAAAALADSAVPLDSAPEPFPAGVDGWMRLFGAHLVERTLTVHGSGPEAWRIFGPANHPARAWLRELPDASAVAICVPVDPDEAALDALFAGARAAGPEGLVMVLQQGGGGAALARCLSLESPGLAVRVADLPFSHPGAGAWVAAEAGAAAPGYTEAHYDAAGVRRVPMTRLLSWRPSDNRPVLGAADVILASGGAKGIGAECAMALAKATGARLGLMGRSAADSPEVRATLARLRAEQIAASYARADVTDVAAVNAAVASIEAALGPVTALLHAAGVNDPAPIARLEMDAVRRTVAVKVGGLRNLLAAIMPGRLRLLAGFGSIIGHHGLAGEAHYALANEWMERAVRAFGAAHPDCHCISPGWSAWSGVGMADRLGVVEALDRSGVAALAPAPATALFVALTQTAPAASFIVAGRFGAPPTVELDPPPLRGRFLENPAVHYPGVELVVGATLTPSRDPYVDDHALGGTRLFPAVLGLEAMAQAAQTLTGARPSLLEALVFQRPVAVGDGGTDIRVVALRREDGSVSAAVRTRDTGFQADHFAGIARAAAELESAAPACYRRTGEVELDQTVLYEHLLFHVGRFRRVESYDFLSATACIARLRPASPGERWFPDRGQDALLLGDPGARDAALHALQAAIPHRRILPASVRRIRLGVLRPDETYTVHGRETGRDGDSFTWDVELHAEDGTLVESWEGLELKAIEALSPPPAWPPSLAACMLERRLLGFLPDRGVRLALTAGRTGDETVARLFESGETIRRRPDGRPEATHPVSVSHAGGLTLAVAATTAAGCDLEPVTARAGQVWRDLLGPDGTALAQVIAHETEEDFDQAATRVWCVQEAVKKAGGTAVAILDRVEDAWVLLRAGQFLVPTWAGVLGHDPHVVAAAIGASGARLEATRRDSPLPGEAPVYSYHHTVSFKDTNLVGNVYFTNHLDWQGRCREMFLRDKAPSVLRELREGLSLVTVRCACDYVAELDAFDEVRVDMRLASLHEDRIDLAFTYWRCNPDGDEVIATGRQDVACLRTVDGVKGPTPVPRELVEALRPFRTGPGEPELARTRPVPMAGVTGRSL